MTAPIHHLYGLRGANLAAFAAAGDLIEAHMRPDPGYVPDPRAEALMQQVRLLLDYARQTFPANRELADAFGAKAANKLALAIKRGMHGNV